jgi:hypothetical protein
VLKEVFLNEELRNGIYISSSHPCNYMPNQLQALWLLGQGMHYMDPHGHRLYLSEVDIGEIIVQFIRLRHLTHGMYIGGTVGQSISHLLSIFPESGNWDGSSSAFVSELSDFLSEEPVRQCIENETFVDFFLQRYSDGMRDVPKEQVMQASLHDICFALRRVSNARDGWFAHLELVQFAAGEGGSAGEHEGSGDDVRGQAGVEDSPGDDVHGQAATEHEEEEYEYEYEEDCDA